MIRYQINSEYFTWLCELACKNKYSEQISYSKLFTYLHSKPFRFVLSRDENVAEYGLALRYQFVYENDYCEDDELYIDGPCSVLEMILALSIKCEDIMDNAQIGDRTKQWFWGMLKSLGLSGMTNDRYDEEYVDIIVERFLDRDYEPDGDGGLFTIRNCDYDLRTVEIWHQLCWYLDYLNGDL